MILWDLKLVITAHIPRISVNKNVISIIDLNRVGGAILNNVV
jgi:hypothetical protein